MAEMKRLLAEIDEQLAQEAFQREHSRTVTRLKAPLVLRAASLDYLSREREEAEAAIRLVELHAAAVVDLDHEPALRMLVQRELRKAEGSEMEPFPEEAPTLAVLADTMRRWAELGVTRESLIYALERGVSGLSS